MIRVDPATLGLKAPKNNLPTPRRSAGNPRDVVTGAARGAALFVHHSLAGVATLVGGPVLGAYRGGCSGFCKGLCAGLVAVAAFPALGACKLANRVLRGACNTPATVYGVLRRRTFDKVTGKWVTYRLATETARYASPEADALLAAHVADRRAFRKAVRKELDARDRRRSGLPPEYPPEESKDSSDHGERGLYEALSVAPTAGPAAIKKAYYKAALRHHPDKHPDDADAAARFAKIGEAYSVLSDPSKRKRYDEDGSVDDDGGGGAPWDPAVYFAMVFGGEGFVTWVGELQIAALVKPPDKESGDRADPVELDFLRRRRNATLARTLVDATARVGIGRPVDAGPAGGGGGSNVRSNPSRSPRTLVGAGRSSGPRPSPAAGGGGSRGIRSEPLAPGKVPLTPPFL